ASRPEVYGFVLLVSLFSAEELIPGWQFVFFFIWWGAAASKLNHHFPFVIQVMISNTPWNRSRKFKSQMYRDYPNDLRPSARAGWGAHPGGGGVGGRPRPRVGVRDAGPAAPLGRRHDRDDRARRHAHVPRPHLL